MFFMKELLIATRNYGKHKEIEAILSTLPIKFYNLNDLSIKEDIEETGDSYEVNAIIKAKFFAELSGIPTLADDSGIQVEALFHELGIHTRRWGAGENATDEEWLEYFLNRMKKEKNKKACFFTTLAFMESKDSKPLIFTGICEGIITDKVEAEYLPGIPLSATFKPKGLPVVYSALSVEDKGKISHRGRAAKQFYDFLQDKYFKADYYAIF